MERGLEMGNGQNFDMKTYLEKRMLEITNLDDRVLFKEIVGKMLLDVYQYNQSAYEALEEKILNECSWNQNEHAVYISMTDRHHYDATDLFMHPMLPRDTKKVEVSYDDVKKALNKGERFRLYTVFLKASVPYIYRITHEERTFKGSIKTQKREYAASFSVKQNEEYMDLIKELYYIFGANYKPWVSICEAYLTKMLDVCLCSVEQMADGEEITGIQVDFEEYHKQIHYDMVPLWNLQPLSEKTSTYPTPSIDKANFEHQIFSYRLKEGCEYLIRNTDVEITNIRRQYGDLFITCPIEKPREWQLYQINGRKGTEQFLYPILSNQYKESFSGNITEMFRKSIKTKSELARLIESFEYQDYVKFRDIHIMDDMPESCAASNYNMDGFIQDEIRIGNSSQTLVIDFDAADSNNYLNEDIMSFLVTQVQKIFAEYRCVGRLV